MWHTTDKYFVPKKGSRVILIYNVDVCDGLNNGAKGIIIDFIRNGDRITHVVVEFDNKEAGKTLKEQQPDTFACLYENGTPIPRLKFTYSVSKQQFREGQRAICIQFPLQLGYAMTVHRTIQVFFRGSSQWHIIFANCYQISGEEETSVPL